MSAVIGTLSGPGPRPSEDLRPEAGRAGGAVLAVARLSGGLCDTCGGTLPAGLATTLGASASMMELQGAASAVPCAPGSSHTPQGELRCIRTQPSASPKAVVATEDVQQGPSRRADLQRPCWGCRSSTPADLPAVLPGACMCAHGPITPAALPSHAAVSPRAAAAAATSGPAPATAEAAPDARASTAESDSSQAASAALWLRVESFFQCVAASPLVQSALLSLELAGSHPVAAHPGMPASEALHWTLGQLLAMHFKAGYVEATEHRLLASLWLLESMESVWRSPATVCLNDYLKHLAVISPEAVVAITADWKRSFCELREAVVAAQADMLHRLGWSLRLDLATEVQPCLELLFRLPQGGEADPPSSSPREAWARRMHRFCSLVQRQAKALSKPPRGASYRPSQGAVARDAEESPSKRPRVQAAAS